MSEAPREESSPPSPPAIRATAPIAINGDRLAGNIVLYGILFEIFLVLLDATINYGRWIDIGPIRRLCNIAREDGLASWFMAAQTLMAGVTLGFLFVVSRHRTEARRSARGWGLLALFFIYMAADDGAEIHERIGSAFKAIVRAAPQEEGSASLGARILDFFPSYPWQFILLPIFATIGVLMLIFLWRTLKPAASRSILVLAMGCFVAAVGLDFVEGLDPDHPWNLAEMLSDRWVHDSGAVRHFSKSLEEFLEMVGMTLLWSLFVRHLTCLPGDSLHLALSSQPE